jgi:hypothetical protein
MKLDDNGKCRLSATFSEAEWGSKARGWAESTTRLTSDQWKAITTDAMARTKKLLLYEAGGEDTPDVDPRAVIEL